MAVEARVHVRHPNLLLLSVGWRTCGLPYANKMRAPPIDIGP